VAYTAYDGVHPTRAALSSISVKDFVAHRFDKWSTPQLTTPDAINDKDLCVLPEKFGGQYLIIHRINGQICADLLDSLDFSKRRIDRCIEMMAPRKGMWDSEKVGIAGPPLKTPKGWLLIYHGISRNSNYRLGAALLDLRNPTVVLARTADPILEPVMPYEQKGQVQNVVFSCGAVVRKDALLVYYGGADTVLCMAKFSMKKLLSLLAPETLAPKAARTKR
jgi:predicted GH43/DUF377 family glycosyl hydrolase